jgi:hypothetical protein
MKKIFASTTAPGIKIPAGRGKSPAFLVLGKMVRVEKVRGKLLETSYDIKTIVLPRPSSRLPSQARAISFELASIIRSNKTGPPKRASWTMELSDK